MATVKFYNTNPVVTSYTDYYPFGYPMPDRIWNGTNYRFGFNGQEKDNEIYGEGKSYSFEFRNYDARLGKWWGIDPKFMEFPFTSPYSYVLNSPLICVDHKGKEVFIIGEDAYATFKAMQEKTSLTLKFDPSSNKLMAIGSPKNELDRALLEAVYSDDIIVNLNTTRENIIPTEYGPSYIEVGMYQGSSLLPMQKSKLGELFEAGLSNDGNFLITKVVATPYFNILQAQKEESAGGNSIGTNALHEILESYISANDSPGSGYYIPESKKDTEVYIKNHYCPIKIKNYLLVAV